MVYLLEHWPRESRPLHLLMSFVPMFPVYVNFIIHVNSQHCHLLGKSWLAKRHGIICVSNSAPSLGVAMM